MKHVIDETRASGGSLPRKKTETAMMNPQTLVQKKTLHPRLLVAQRILLLLLTAVQAFPPARDRPRWRA
jgi:hypothetical protein